MTIMGKKINCQQVWREENGMSLIAMALLVLVLGSFAGAGSLLYGLWEQQRQANVTAERIDHIQQSLHAYLAQHGHYPCAADPTAALDTAAFGEEADCRTAPAAGSGGKAKISESARCRSEP